MIAALYVQPRGCYQGVDGVDPWDERRDARQYAGPHPVVAHPPCARWGNYWFGSPSGTKRYQLGDDGGCFSAALSAVRQWGGVLEHPANSKAWAHHGIPAPPFGGGWIEAPGGWTCCVEQGHYGHMARKPTWLYCSGPRPEDLAMGPSAPPRRPGDSPRRGMLERLSKNQRAATPSEFRDVLLSIARRERR